MSSRASRRSRADNSRTRSTTRPNRVEVERIIVPLAEIKTAGVIIAVSTASDEVRASMALAECIAAHAPAATCEAGLAAARAGFWLEKAGPKLLIYARAIQHRGLHR